MKNKYLYIFIFFIWNFTSIAYAQDFLTGVVVSQDDYTISSVLVYNINNQHKTYTDSYGNFVIEGKPNAELRFVKEGYERKTVKTVENTNLNVVLTKIPIEIEEVRISNLTGNLKKDAQRIKVDHSKEELEKAIGLPKPKGIQREKIPDLKKDLLAPLIFASLNIDALYKLASGDARKKKNLYNYEDLQRNVKWIRERVEEEYFVNSNIPTDQITTFLEFVVLSNPKISADIKANNIEKIRFDLMNFFEEFTSRSKEMGTKSP